MGENRHLDAAGKSKQWVPGIKSRHQGIRKFKKPSIKPNVQASILLDACRSLASVEKLPPELQCPDLICPLLVFFSGRYSQDKTTRKQVKKTWQIYVLKFCLKMITSLGGKLCAALLQTSDRPCTTLQSSDLQSLGCSAEMHLRLSLKIREICFQGCIFYFFTSHKYRGCGISL